MLLSEATKADLEVLCDSVKEAVYEADLEYSYDEEESDEDEEENEDEEDVEEEEEKPCAEKKSPAQPERSSSLVRGFQIGLSRLFRNVNHLQCYDFPDLDALISETFCNVTKRKNHFSLPRSKYMISDFE